MNKALTAFEKKKEQRKTFIEKRKELSLKERNEKSSLIMEKFISLPEYKEAKSIFAYVATKYEVETVLILKKALADGKCVSLPFIVGQGEMKAVLLENMDDLVVGDYGILTIAENERKFISAIEIDLALVPGVAFDRLGARLGMGGGYYDRFLVEAKNAKRIAIAFFEQLVDEVVCENHDLLMDLVVTDRELLIIKGD